MPGITNPAEEYFKDGLWAWVTDQWKKLVATAGGALHVQIAGQEAEVEVKQTAPADLTPGICGWDGAAWRKLPLLFGYSETWAQYVYAQADGAGDASCSTTPVSAGYIYILQQVSVFTSSAGTPGVTAYLSDGVNFIGLVYPLAAVQNQRYFWAGQLALKEGDIVVGDAYAPGDDQWVYLRVWGYKMKITE